MESIVFAKFDMDAGCVYALTDDCNLILIDCDKVEEAYADNMFERSNLDYLIYNDPKAYAELVWDQYPESYLKTTTEYYSLSSQR